MSTLYFLCGGPYSDDLVETVFANRATHLRTASGIFSHCGESNGQIAVMHIKDYWIVSGDSSVVFDLHEEILPILSERGKALALFGQTTAAYFEIIAYKNGVETGRTLDPYTEDFDRPKVKRKELWLDDLWSAANKLLPKSTTALFNLPADWYSLKKRSSRKKKEL